MTNKLKFQAIRGTRDLLPPEIALWNRVEQTAHEVFATYGFGEIRLPIFEPTELFARSIGADTDVVSKEMYTFEDCEEPHLLKVRELFLNIEHPHDLRTPAMRVLELQEWCRKAAEAFEKGTIPRTPENKNWLTTYQGQQKYIHSALEENRQSELLRTAQFLKDVARSLELGDQLTLRPEATASVCRAYIEHNMQQLPQPVKLYYMGPMFRRERPQKGRYRQFYQIGAEVLEAVRPEQGSSLATRHSPLATLLRDAATDAEVIEMVMTYFGKLELQGVQLDINSIGCKNCRSKYVEQLHTALLKVKDKLGADSQRRIDTNPLRVLDSKLESEQPIIEKLPRISEHLCEECKTHYAAVKRELDLRSVKYSENWRLVRGLDYYMRTTFEITAAGLGSQNAVCGGGRYDGLIELLGGPPTKGIGFAIGEDRLILSLQEGFKTRGVSADSPFATRYLFTGPQVYIAWMGEKAYATAVQAAKNLRAGGFKVELPPQEQKFAKALDRASRLGSRYALILGDNEVASGEWTLKTLADGSQQKVAEPALLDFLRKSRALSS